MLSIGLSGMILLFRLLSTRLTKFSCSAFLLAGISMQHLNYSSWRSLDQLLKVLNWSMPTNILIFPCSEDLCQLIWIIQANGHSLHHTIPIILAVANHVKTSETVDTYCICDGPEYGEMIACDDDECPVEWFHLACVGLKTAPKGKWKCPECGYVSYIFCACLPNVLLYFHLSSITTLFL